MQNGGERVAVTRQTKVQILADRMAGRPDSYLKRKVKVKLALKQAKKAQRGSRGIVLLFL